MRPKGLLHLLALVLSLACTTFAAHEPEGDYHGFAFSPDGSYLLAVYSTGEALFIYRVPLDTGKAVRLTDAKVGFEGIPSFSADGKHIAYSYAPANGSSPVILVANSDGSNPRPLADGKTSGLGALMSPDGKSVVFKRYGYYGHYSPIAQSAPHAWDFYMADLDGTDVRQLTNNSYYMVSPASLSPDGKTLVFVNSFEEIVLYPLANGSAQSTRLKPTLNGKKADAYSQAIFSADGKSVLFTAAFTSNFWGRFNYNVYRLDLGTRVVEPLTTDKGHDGTLAVSRDGQWIVFVHDEYKHETSTVLLLNLLTRKLRPLTISGIQ